MSPTARSGERAPGLVLLIDGPTGVGVSTTVAALQEAWPRVRPGPLLDVGIDHAFRNFGPELHRWWDLIEAPEAASDVGGHWGPLGRELIRSLPEVAALWARAGWDVVVDHVLRDRATATELRDAVADLPRFHVGLTCDPDVLEDRARGSGSEGTGELRARKALAELAVFGAAAQRDLVLDTTELETDELVGAILTSVEAQLLG